MDPSCLNYYGLDIPRSFGEDERNEEVEDDDGDASQTDGKHYFTLYTHILILQGN